MSYLWHLWPGRGWPHTFEEERELLSEWQRRSEDRSGRVRRDALIAVMGALRTGSTADELHRVTPAIAFEDLHASYCHLDALRRAAQQGLEKIYATGSESSLRRHGRVAATLCPAPVALLRRSLRAGGVEALQGRVRAAAARSAQVRAEADAVAEKMPGSADPKTTGRLLFDPYTPGLWGDPYFIAVRVGELTPVRVRTLLGEDPESDLIFTDVHEIAHRPAGSRQEGGGAKLGSDTAS